MNTLLIAALVVGVVSADISLTYKVPQTSYGVPSYQLNNNAGEYNTGYSDAGGYNYNAQSSAQAGYQGASFGQQTTGYQNGQQSINSLGDASIAKGYQITSGAGNPHYQTGSSSSGLGSVAQPTYQYNGAASQGGYQAFNQYQTSSQYQASAVQKYKEFYSQGQQQPAQVFKHFYVHAAPEDPEPPRIRQAVTLPPPQKHYKIIFIKSPTQTVYTPQYVPIPQQNEEKTIVYVLVKKPEDQQQIAIPKIEQKAPAKPEVYFIKYKNKADSQAVINNIVNDYNKGDSVNFVSDIGSSAGQTNVGTGQYTSGSGQYTQGSYNDQYVQNGQGSQAAAVSGFGSQSLGGSTEQSLNVASADSSAATSAYDAAVGSVGYTSTGATAPSGATSALNYGNLNTISTSQGVPHESYGPPKFRV